MKKFFSMLETLATSSVETTIRKNEYLCAYFTSGFYQSDGDAYLMQPDELLILYTKHGGQKHIETFDILVNESHLCWKLARNLKPQWKHPNQVWLPLYKRFGLEGA